ncbi:SH3 domain-containing protein [Mesorhizobium sp. M0051]|uniref:SH3 domain-containing protein n=1 Tax=unclassified Mesorhizobium TaxID=325217 RepID=UPI0004CF4A37|nr:SH3 domain-containing protein [Mesorhizobium sp. LNHC252B00]
MRRTVTLRTSLHALIVAPLLMAAWPVLAPTMAEEAPDLVFSIVTGLAPDDLLNLRTKPSPVGKTETRLASGARVKNLGCNDIDGHQWCKVETDDAKASGWAPARYLVPLNPAPFVEGETKPADAPVVASTGDAAGKPDAGAAAEAAAQPPPDLAARLGGTGPATESIPKTATEIGRAAMQDAYGLALAAAETSLTGDVQDAAASPPPAAAADEIPCARYVGQPMQRCTVSAVRTADKADITVTWPDGGTRIISFVAGKPASSDAPGDFRFTREGSLNMIRVGVSERFEITDQLALGD